MKNLGSAIKELRAAKGWTQDDLHIRLDISLSTTARFEAGGKVDFVNAAKMAEWALEVGRPDLAVVFRAAIINELGQKVVDLLRREIIDEGKTEATDQSNGDKGKIRAGRRNTEAA